jgi:undecaprenol kinase
MIKLKRLAKSVTYALKGIKKVFKQEQNFRIHSLVALIVLFLAILLKIEAWQLVILILIIALIFILELINSIFERLLDLLKPRMHHYVKDIKDMTAATVFIGAIAAVIIGLMIFLPYLIKLFG